MKKLNHLLKATTFMIMSIALNQSSFGQVQGYWNLQQSGGLLQNVTTSGSTTINEMWLNTNNNTRVRIFPNGQWQINAWSGAGGFISTPPGQADFATFKIRAGGTSGLVSYSFQNRDWGQNIQSYVGRANTVSYIVNWNGNDRFYVAGQGWLYANGAWFGSNRHLKEDIKPLENSLEKVLKLQGYSYRFKEEKLCDGCDSATSPIIDRKLEIGLLADEVEAVVPEVVRTIDNDKKGIAYQNVVALLIESTKEQQEMIVRLQTQVRMITIIGSILFLIIFWGLFTSCRRKRKQE